MVVQDALLIERHYSYRFCSLARWSNLRCWRWLEGCRLDSQSVGYCVRGRSGAKRDAAQRCARYR
eukprot:gene6478-259_t